jgi:hypothetical protein
MNSRSKEKRKLAAEAFDKKFSAGEDLSDHVDWSKAVKRINLDIPLWAIKDLDKEATRRGITRQSLIKTWIIDRLDEVNQARHEAM